MAMAMALRSGGRDPAQPGGTLLVIHNFAARSGDELTLAKGDRVELIERDDDFGDGWFMGRHIGNGKTGLFPEVYTTPAPKPTLNNAVQQRRGSEGLPTPRPSETATPTSPVQQRHASASAASPRSVPSASAEQAAITAMALRTSLPQSTSSRSDAMTTQSPVMNETLSVIDEHMNDMNTPPGSFTSRTKRNSTGGLGRYSYIAGQETDDEENDTHTEDEVMGWTPQRVAEYLEDHGVEKAHCNIFLEQEISGEVLLAMEQSSIFLKEFELGSVGRRLKTWHKVRALQDEVRQVTSPGQRSTSEYIGDEDADEASRNRAATVGAVLPRALDTSRQSISVPAKDDTLQSAAVPAASPPTSPMQSMPSVAGQETTWKPSAQSIREMQFQRRQSRRQSSLDAEAAADLLQAGNRDSHRKQPSLDQNWQPGQPQTNGGHSHTLSAESALAPVAQQGYGSHSPSLPISPTDDVDKGYFSSNEADSRQRYRRKPVGSNTAGSSAASRNGNAANRRSTLSAGYGSQTTSARNSTSPTVTQGIFGALNSVGSSLGSLRSTTSPEMRRWPMNSGPEALSPVVTKLDYSGTVDGLTSSPNTMAGAEVPGNRSASSPKMPFFAAQKSRMTGLRTISDAVTRNERSTVKDTNTSSPARTGSSTPSNDSRSVEFQKSEAQSRLSSGSGTNLAVPPANQRKIRVKPKKATSAYTRGLEKKPPSEQMVGSDYSGWMKKKSGSLMTTWKTRLFVLKGRRLSYYYSDNDTEEKGLIDISFHRVLPAHNETLTGLHATMTGAATNPTSPKETSTPTAAQKDLAEHPSPGDVNDGVFIFKLVPPKSGLSKGVNFTKPAVHYFAVNSRQEGRLWMAALMKATIDRDEGGMVTTTYNQKTISLAKARARRERPPALMESDGEKETVVELEGDTRQSQGLGIGGLDADKGGDAVGGGEMEQRGEDASSLAPSTAATGMESFMEKESVATAAS